jgi:hypothetical protein
MKAKLGPNIVLRLKFSQHPQGEEIGDGKGYEIVATNDEADNLALEMVNVSAGHAVENSSAPEATPLMTEEPAESTSSASPENASETPAAASNE